MPVRTEIRRRNPHGVVLTQRRLGRSRDRRPAQEHHVDRRRPDRDPLRCATKRPGLRQDARPLSGTFRQPPARACPALPVHPTRTGAYTCLCVHKTFSVDDGGKAWRQGQQRVKRASVIIGRLFDKMAGHRASSRAWSPGAKRVTVAVKTATVAIDAAISFIGPPPPRNRRYYLRLRMQPRDLRQVQFKRPQCTSKRRKSTAARRFPACAYCN